MTDSAKGRLATLAMFSPLVIYLLALNPWFIPDQHDDVLYFFGAVSLLENDSFALGGTPITDWPPVLSAVLATSMKLTGPSIWCAKLLVIAFVAVGIGMSYSVARLYGFPAPRAIAALTGLLPISLISGAAVLSEWPYLALSMAFFWALSRLMETRAWRWAIAVGVMLAMASLTRFVGVFLGAAILVQVFHLARRAGLRSAIPEVVAVVIGAVPWLLWKLRCQSVISKGEAPVGAYDDAAYYLDRFSHIEPLELLSKMEAALLSLGKVGDKLLGGEWVGIALGLIVGGAVLLGLVLRIRRTGLSPVDAYVLVCLLLLLGDLHKPERYFAPLAPFLVGYLILAGGLLLKARQGVVAIACWAAWLLALDGYLLFVGNSDGSRGGFSMLSNAQPEDFYRGEFRDLYLALRWAGENAPAGPFEAVGFHGKYALAFAGRGFEERDGEPVALIAPSGSTIEGWQAWQEFGAYTVYRK